MGGMGRNGKVSVIEREFKDIFEIEFGVVTQPGAAVGGRVLTLGDSKFPAVEAICFLAGPIGHAHEDHAFIIYFG
jgi:hypothetical protein